jgi:uncharacterized protein YecE (DUF72 family)
VAKNFIGTSGFSQQQFYPDKTKSADKFYHFPREKTLENWQSSVSKDFVFAFKVHQTITRSKHINDELLDNWFSIFEIFAFKNPQHIMLFQFSASYDLELDYFSRLIKTLPKTFLYAFEFRHQSWFTKEIFDLVTEEGMVIVLNDSPVINGESMWPKVDVTENPFLYLRFHGSPKLYYSNYSEAELKDYAALIKQKNMENKNALIYFNNDAQGYATKNALELKKMLEI